MIRSIMPRDIERLKELQPFEWEFGSDFLDGLVLVDENDIPIVFAGAWMRAETHIAMDKAWSTPGARYLAIKEIHDAMNDSLKKQGISQVVTWFDDVKCRFVGRLKTWGWVQSSRTSLHRRIT